MLKLYRERCSVSAGMHYAVGASIELQAAIASAVIVNLVSVMFSPLNRLLATLVAHYYLNLRTDNLTTYSRYCVYLISLILGIPGNFTPL